eukprot:CCRYP_004676-RD/>CCRYP_004676-RD protein AED:0.44 eAED:0.44 QI:0/0/0/1/0/0/2/0/270
MAIDVAPSLLKTAPLVVLVAIVVTVLLIVLSLSIESKPFDLLGNNLAITTRSAAAILPNILPISFELANGVKSLAAAKKLTVPPMYDPQRHPARMAVVILDGTIDDVDCDVNVVIGTKINETMHPNIEPMLPMTNGVAMFRIQFLVTLKSVEDGVDCDSVSSDNCLDEEDDERRANTSDAGKNKPQHQSYRKCSVGTLGTRDMTWDRFETKAANNNVNTCPPPEVLEILSNKSPNRVPIRRVPLAAIVFDEEYIDKSAKRDVDVLPLFLQ